VNQNQVSFEKRVRSYWLYFALGLFLLLVVDLFTTMIATTQYGLGVESNPLMRWLLTQGLFVVTLVHVLVAIAVVYLFHCVLESARGSSAPLDRYLETLIQAWLGGMLAVGTFVVLNNLSAIFLRSSIL